jgi:hypothetical protein
MLQKIISCSHADVCGMFALREVHGHNKNPAKIVDFENFIYNLAPVRINTLFHFESPCFGFLSLWWNADKNLRQKLCLNFCRQEDSYMSEGFPPDPLFKNLQYFERVFVERSPWAHSTLSKDISGNIQVDELEFTMDFSNHQVKKLLERIKELEDDKPIMSPFESFGYIIKQSYKNAMFKEAFIFTYFKIKDSLTKEKR